MVLVSGCWDNIELNDQAIQLSIGMDWTEQNTYLLSNQFARNAKSSDGELQSEEGFYTETAEGKAPVQAMSVMESKVTRSINRGQRRSLIIGDKMARKGFRQIIDYLLRNAESPLRMDLIIVKDGQAVDMLKSKTPFGAQSLREYYKLHQINFKTVDILLMSLIRNMNEGKHYGIFMPAVEKVKGSTAGEDGGKEASYRFAGSAVLNNDTKLIGYLNEEETNNSLWIRKFPHRQVLTIEAPDGTGTISAELNHMSSSWRLKDAKHIREGELSILINLKSNVVIIENTSNMDLLNVKVLDEIQSEMQKEAEQQMKHLMVRYQDELKKDGFGVGDYLYRNHPKQWRIVMDRWEKVFPKTDISFRVKLKMTRFGLTGTGGYLKQQEVSNPH